MGENKIYPSNKKYTSNNTGIVTLPEASIELHAHPFLNVNTVFNVTLAMEENEVDVAALQGPIDESIFKEVSKKIKQYYAGTVKDSAGIRYNGTSFIFNSREYTTKEGFHLLTIGYSFNPLPNTEIRTLIENGLKNDALVVIAHPFVDNGKTKTAGHISKEKEKELENLCKEYKGQIALEWNGYCHPGLRRRLQDVLNIGGHKTEYSDVNNKVYNFAFSPEMFKYRIPVVPGTDLHAINGRYLQSIGTSRLWADIKGETPADILGSLKNEIFTRNSKFVDSYASAPHVIGAFGIPILKQMLFGKESEK